VKRPVDANKSRWSSGEIILCSAWVLTAALGGWYAVNQGVSADQLFFTLFLSSIIALGAYDTRHNQPTQYNLMRSWPFGSAIDDDRRGKRTVASQALHALMCVSVCLCLLQIAFRHPKPF
jgi:hypothetical protein